MISLPSGAISCDKNCTFMCRARAKEDGNYWNFWPLLTDSRWFSGIPTVRAIDVSVLSGWSLADECFSITTFLVIPLKIWITSPHVGTVGIRYVVWLT